MRTPVESSAFADSPLGPVIGPLVMAAVAIEEKDLDKIKSTGAKDSKLLTPRQREDLYEVIKNISKTDAIIVSPKEIDDAVESKTTNLNWLEADKTILLINKLKPKKAILDCPSTNTTAYKEYIQNKLTSKTELIVEHKADLKYPIVSAASIIAKVTRDAEIEKLKQKHNVNFGSGYPSDPATKEFIKKNYSKYDFFRKSWATYKKIANKGSQKSLGEF